MMGLFQASIQCPIADQLLLLNPLKLAAFRQPTIPSI